MEKWYTLQEAERILGVSERSIRRRVAAGQIESKKEGGRRFVMINDEAAASVARQEVDSDVSITLGQYISELKVEITRLNAIIEKKDIEAAEASQRHDTIVLQLTRQLEQSQRLLEYTREPWWRRWFRRE